MNAFLVDKLEPVTREDQWRKLIPWLAHTCGEPARAQKATSDSI